MAEPANEREALRRRFLAIETANAADMLDALGRPDQGLAADFRPLGPSDARLAGWAYTIRGEFAEYPAEEGDPTKMEACAALGPGSISVWSGGAAEGICFFGELIAIGMKERCCAGALVDGGVRDIAWLEHHGFPVFARYRTPIQSIGRWRVVDHACSLDLPGATRERVPVEPGDVILADSDGALVIPNGIAIEILEQAERLGAREVEIRRELARGMPLSDALAKYGHV